MREKIEWKFNSMFPNKIFGEAYGVTLFRINFDEENNCSILTGVNIEQPIKSQSSLTLQTIAEGIYSKVELETLSDYVGKEKLFKFIVYEISKFYKARFCPYDYWDSIKQAINHNVFCYFRIIKSHDIVMEK